MDGNERFEYARQLPGKLTVIPPPGLSALKANEMENKILKKLPIPEKFKYYYKRLDDALRAEVEKLKQSKAKKQKEKAQEKKKRKTNGD